MISEEKINCENLKPYSYIALGSFDGVHIGHGSLVNKITRLAKENGGKSIVYTFSNHPRKFVKPNLKLKLLLDNKTKVNILKTMGVDEVYFEEFNEEFMELSPEEFIKYLVEKFNVRGIVVGFNYKFGYKNLGNTDVLRRLSQKYKYELFIMEPCTYKEKVVSSTRIRQEIMEGNVTDALGMLGRPYMLRGNVVYGKQIGRTIGFPTANLEYSNKLLLPKIGVYYVNVFVNNNIYKGITSVGTNPTVHGSEITVETYILDFDKDIYDYEIVVAFIKKIRNQQKFNSIDDLKNQLHKDKSFAKFEKLYNKNEKYLHWDSILI